MKIYAIVVSLALIASICWSLDAQRQMEKARKSYIEARATASTCTDLVDHYKDEVRKAETEREKNISGAADLMTLFDTQVARNSELQQQLTKQEELIDTYSQLCQVAADVLDGKKSAALTASVSGNLRKLIANTESERATN